MLLWSGAFVNGRQNPPPVVAHKPFLDRTAPSLDARLACRARQKEIRPAQHPALSLISSTASPFQTAPFFDPHCWPAIDGHHAPPGRPAAKFTARPSLRRIVAFPYLNRYSPAPRWTGRLAPLPATALLRLPGQGLALPSTESPLTSRPGLATLPRPDASLSARLPYPASHRPTPPRRRP